MLSGEVFSPIAFLLKLITTNINYMKKIILFAALFFAGITQAQDLITVTTTGNTVVDQGEIFNYDVLYAPLVNPHAGKLPLVISNISQETLNLKLRVDSMINANGNSESVSFCFYTSCYFSVTPGSLVPATGTGLTLAPGEATTTDNHFANSWAGDTQGQPVVYNLSIVRVDDNGAVMGEPLRSFTYRYSPTMSTTDIASLQNIGINVDNTILKTQLNVTATQNATLELYSTTGQFIKSFAIMEGFQSIDVSELSSAVYIAKFKNSSNQASSIRIIKN